MFSFRPLAPAHRVARVSSLVETDAQSHNVIRAAHTQIHTLKMAEDDEKKPLNFHQMELDDRILKAIAQLGWLSPTLIQENAIPLLLEGKDVLVRARTGSGKTAAFAIPCIQKILSARATATQQQTSTLMLAPSKELCHQIHNVVQLLCAKCPQVQCVDLASYADANTQKLVLSKRPDIVVSTPARILAQLRGCNVYLRDCLETLVIDEADLLFSFGYERDLRALIEFLPSIYQAVLASATLSDDVSELKTIFLHNPVVLRLEEPELAPTAQLSHYHVQAEENDKAAILYALFKLRLVQGKSIVFVNTVNRCIKLKLFLAQFGITTCVLNSELPAKMRCHAVSQFNQGIYDIIIASDEQVLDAPAAKRARKAAANSAEGPSTGKGDKEAGVARGIDFHCVSNVVNFDFPLDVASYIHRAGRTARGNNTGSVLSFVDMSERPLMQAVEAHLQAGFSTADAVLKSYQFKLEEVEAFRYRAMDAWRAITKVTVRDARNREIKEQLLACEELKAYFEANQREKQVLNTVRAAKPVKKQLQLAEVPDYIVPDALKRMARISTLKRGSAGKRPHPAEGRGRAIFASQLANPLMVAKVDYAKRKRR